MPLFLRQICNSVNPSTKHIPISSSQARASRTIIHSATATTDYIHLATPGISAQEYADRRAKLAGSLPSNGIAILAAADTKYRSGAVFYEFHQETNFFYLTGFNEPEAVAVIQRVGSSQEYSFHLFLRPKDARAELWDGARTGEQAALDVFNADEVCTPSIGRSKLNSKSLAMSTV